MDKITFNFDSDNDVTPQGLGVICIGSACGGVCIGSGGFACI
ncbi:hypothetical protein CcarbDRAFT_4996 [Clostridium carboxidivorans P7]|uniref:Uncharacterized protein n=1 Tax=Clostridium carboxidivorans P7 TaxID=536227 RepID=C6Q1S8_9CLOT|nr:hypothetical protein [Clostridium carboxidivorans]EET84545.1 hypothetical protein CcarbDRAFT_4996 [Clostridium carboxidivorans P7]EFG89845.1 lipoprotein, putative [Clostridium carboxidivorans P7]